MKLFFLILAIVVSTRSCHQKSIESIDGVWISKEDSMSKIVFNKIYYLSIYGVDTISKGTFERRIYSCDTRYMAASVKADFIWLKGDGGTCYEITGITDSSLAYRYTTSGRLHVFFREKKAL